MVWILVVELCVVLHKTVSSMSPSLHVVLEQVLVRGVELFLATEQVELMASALKLHCMNSGGLVELRR